MSEHSHSPRTEDLFLTRRDFLHRCGMGMGALALGTILGETGIFRARAADTMNPLTPKPPQFPAKAKRVIHLFMNGGPSHVDTFDPKPELTKYPRQGNPRPAFPPSARRRRLRLAVQVSEIRAERHRSQRALRENRRVHRRHLRHPLDARRRAESRAVAAADELRRSAADPPQHRLVGHLWPRQREPEPARLHRHVPRRLSRSRNRRTGSRGFLPGVYQGTYIDTKHTEIEKLIENIRNSSVTTPRAARSSSICCSSSTPSTSAARQNDAQLEARIQSFELGLPHADGRRRRLRHRARAAAHPRHVRRRHAGPADAHRPAARRARRPLRAGLARRRSAVGQSRRHRSQPPPARRASAIRPSARSSRI